MIESGACATEGGRPSVERASNPDAAISFRAYPSPATDKITVEWIVLLESNGVELRMYNALGQIAYAQNMALGTKTIEVPVASLPNGIYWIGINQKAPYQKIQIQH